MQHKTQRPVQFEITLATRDAVQKWIKLAALKSDAYLFPSRIHDSPHLGTRQYARILEGWVEELGLDPADYGTHSVRRTKATLIYRRTKNLRAVQLLLGHSIGWNPQCATLASRWTTPWKSRSRRKSDSQRCRPVGGHQNAYRTAKPPSEPARRTHIEVVCR